MDKKTPSKLRLAFLLFRSVRLLLLGFQAVAHELLSLIALQLLFAGIGITNFHFLLLRDRRRFGAEAVAHKLLALIAFELLFAGIGVAGFHFVLLRLLRGRRGFLNLFGGIEAAGGKA